MSSSPMSVSPEHDLELIEVETPPNSPSATLDFSGPLAALEDTRGRVISPLKCPRASTEGQSYKRGRHVGGTSGCRGKTVRGDEDQIDNTEVSQTGDGDDDERSAELSSYELYVIAVSEGHARLQIVQKRLFAVQGWDAKSHCTMVRLLSLYEYMLANHALESSSQHGITYNASLLGQLSMSPVFALRVL